MKISLKIGRSSPVFRRSHCKGLRFPTFYIKKKKNLYLHDFDPHCSAFSRRLCSVPYATPCGDQTSDPPHDSPSDLPSDPLPDSLSDSLHDSLSDLQIRWSDGGPKAPCSLRITHLTNGLIHVRLLSLYFQTPTLHRRRIPRERWTLSSLSFEKKRLQKSS